MMSFFIGLAIIAGLVALWATLIRPWLRTKSWAAGFFAWIEPIEITLWRKSETILWARLKMLVGVLLTVLTQVGTLDITPIIPLVPDHENLIKAVFGLLPLVITLMGWIDEQLRKDTTKPLELVSLASHEMTPEVAQAVAVAQEAKAEAVAVVKAAKGEVIKEADTEPPKGGG